MAESQRILFGNKKSRNTRLLIIALLAVAAAILIGVILACIYVTNAGLIFTTKGGNYGSDEKRLNQNGKYLIST